MSKATDLLDTVSRYGTQALKETDSKNAEDIRTLSNAAVILAAAKAIVLAIEDLGDKLKEHP